MGKHPKSKTHGTKHAAGARPEPYSKKAKVEVKFEGQPAAKASKTSKQPASSVPPVKQAPPAKDKGKAKAIVEAVDTPLTPRLSNGSFVVVAGSYEKLLYGIEGTYAPGEDKPTLKPIFIFPAHLACVKAVAASSSGKWLASGSEDEFVKVWDLRRRKEVGSLSQHTGESRVSEARADSRLDHVAALPNIVPSHHHVRGLYALAVPHVRLGLAQIA